MIWFKTVFWEIGMEMTLGGDAHSEDARRCKEHARHSP